MQHEHANMQQAFVKYHAGIYWKIISRSRQSEEAAIKQQAASGQSEISREHLTEHHDAEHAERVGSRHFPVDPIIPSRMGKCAHVGEVSRRQRVHVCPFAFTRTHHHQEIHLNARAPPVGLGQGYAQ